MKRMNDNGLRYFFCFILLIFSTSTFAQGEFIQLAWSPNIEPDLSHYKMYRDNMSGTMVYLDSISASDTIYTDMQVVNGDTYYYKLTAVDLSGNESDPSNEVFATAGVLAAVNDDGKNTIKNFDLKQNYPNPFNPTTTIEYSLPQQSSISITIYNISGQEVRKLLSEFKEPGTYKVEWDGKDNNGRAVSSGVYFYQMMAGGYKGVKRSVFRK